MKGHELQDWITAAGTLLTGLAAIGALGFGTWQFRRSGFTYRARATIDEDFRVIRIAVLNTGRTAGQIEYLEIRNRRSIRVRISLARQGQRGTYDIIPAQLLPGGTASRTTTISGQVQTGDVGIDLSPGHTLVTYAMRPLDADHLAHGYQDRDWRGKHPPFVGVDDDAAEKRRWILVRIGFGDGRVVNVVPKKTHGIFVPVAPATQTAELGVLDRVIRWLRRGQHNKIL
jgi:hypothetical protein